MPSLLLPEEGFKAMNSKGKRILLLKFLTAEETKVCLFPLRPLRLMDFDFFNNSNPFGHCILNKTLLYGIIIF
jgi:hypothetical protein